MCVCAVLSQYIALPNTVTIAFCQETFESRRFAMEVFRAEEDEGCTDDDEASVRGGEGGGTSHKGSVGSAGLPRRRPNRSLPPFEPETLFVGIPNGLFMLRMVPVVMQVCAVWCCGRWVWGGGHE